jgi:hypothetical protein
MGNRQTPKPGTLVGDGEIFRCTSHAKKYDRVVLIGNGAVQNGWLPLSRALKIEGSPDFLASTLASHAALYRGVRADLLLKMSLTDDMSDKTVAAKAEHLKRLIPTRWHIGSSYVHAVKHNEISLRECKPISEILYSSDTAIITTNWDELLWNDSRIENLIQLHGRASTPESLILPSEIRVEDDLHFAIICQPQVSKWLEALKLENHFHDASRSGLLNAEYKAAYWIAHAKELFVWGLAAHPYDAELINTLEIFGNVVPKDWKEKLRIINPDAQARHRIASLLRKSWTDRYDLDFDTGEWVTGANK